MNNSNLKHLVNRLTRWPYILRFIRERKSLNVLTFVNLYVLYMYYIYIILYINNLRKDKLTKSG
jgi:hypothetical protein